MGYHHISVMRNEAVDLLSCKPGGIYVDGTLGGAGHASLILKRIQPGGRLIGIDLDVEAVDNAEKVLGSGIPEVSLFNDSYGNLEKILSSMGISGVNGILLDLGLSLNQLVNSRRGFSFKVDEHLDMRMDIRWDVTAADIINGYDERRLESVFRGYGEERFSRPIARMIAKERKKKRIQSSRHLADIVSRVVSRKGVRSGKIHPATRVFMALRIAVNRELSTLEEFLENAADLLKPGGRLGILSFHSLEDRIVKHSFRRVEKGCTCPLDFPRCVCGKKPLVKVLTKKAVKPSTDEVRANPMSRSARLRGVEKI